MTTSDESNRGGILIPTWAVGIVVGATLAVGGWTASTIMSLRDSTNVIAEKVRVLEAGDANRAALPTAVIRLETKVDAMTSELTALREDIRRIRVQGAPR